MSQSRDDAPAGAADVTVEHIEMLARLAGLPLDPRRAPILAEALRADLRLIGALRGVDVGDLPPATMRPLPDEPDGGVRYDER